MNKRRAQWVLLAVTLIVATLLLVPPDGWPRTAAYIALVAGYLAGNVLIERRG